LQLKEKKKKKKFGGFICTQCTVETKTLWSRWCIDVF